MKPPALLVLCVALAACASPRPVRFTDAPPVREVADDAPIPLPRDRDPLEEVLLSEAYVRRPVLEALDPGRFPDAADVSTEDEVPRSTWFSPEGAEAASEQDDPPAPPFRLLQAPPSTGEGALPVVDSRGRRFELRRDPADRPGMRTAAAAIASRLLRGLGYFTPGVWVDELAWRDFAIRRAPDHDALRAFFRGGPRVDEGRYRVAITRWPIGIDVGPTPGFGTRGDDPNDRVPHGDRRTLRALALVFGWLGVTHLAPGLLRDAYVGAPGRGHLVHYLVALDGALGADAVVRPAAPASDDSDLAERNPWITLGTLGLYTQRLRPTQDRWPAIGAIDERWAPGSFGTSPPFEPLDRALPADTYWAAKRIIAITPRAIDEALAAARLADASAVARLRAVLLARRTAAMAWALARVTPCEVEGVAAGPGGGALLLRDEAVRRWLADAAATRYQVELFDARGRVVGAPPSVRVEGARIAIALPEAVRDYLVVRVVAVRGDVAARRFEAHLVRRGAGWGLVGVRH